MPNSQKKKMQRDRKKKDHRICFSLKSFQFLYLSKNSTPIFIKQCMNQPYRDENSKKKEEKKSKD